MRTTFAVLSLVAAAAAIQVTYPTDTADWFTSGANSVKWSAVSTDPTNFTLLLVNEHVNPPTSQVLAALVQTSLGSVVVGPPSGGWPTGSDFQVNFVKDTDDTSTIYAQSGQFNFTSGSASTTQTGASTIGSAGAAPTGVPPTASAPLSPTPVTTASGGASTTDTSTDLNPTTTPKNGAAGLTASAGLAGAIAALAAFVL